MASVPYSEAAGTDAVPQTDKLLSPNQAPRTGEAVKQTDEHEDLIRTIKRMHQRAKQARKSREAKWTEYWDWYNGKQWPGTRASTKASPNVNIIRPVVQTVLPILTDTSPSFGLVATDPTDFDFAELLVEVVRKWWNRRLMNHALVEALMDTLVTDVGIFKVVWNPDLYDGVGDVDVVVRDPRNVYVADTAIDFNRNCTWVIDEFYMTRGQLSLKFQDKKKEIAEAPTYNKAGGTSTEDTRVRLVSPIDSDQPAPDNNEAGVGSLRANDDIRVWEVWLDDDTVIESEQIDEKSGEVNVVLKKQYPHGRVVTLLPDASVIVQDIENPYRDGEKPFVRFVDSLIPRCFYGDGEVAPLMESQRMINKTFATILDWANLMSNPCWIVDNNSGVDPDMLTNTVGQIIVKNPGTQVGRQEAPSMPPQMFEIYHTFMSLVDQQSGVHDVTQGRKPAGITAAQAIETLQEAAQTRIRLKERNLLVSLTRLGQLIVSRMLQYYTEPRVIEMTGRDDQRGKWPKYVKFFVEHVTQGPDGEWGPSLDESDVAYRPVTQEVEYDENTEGYVEQPAQTGSPSVGNFEIEVTTGSSMPYLKEQKSQLALRMFDSKAIDQEALLDITEFPMKEQILTRMQKAAEQQAAQAPQG